MPADGPPPSSSSLSSLDEGASGAKVVLGLFVILALCVLFIFSIFAWAVRPEDRQWLPTLTARYLYMPVVATSILVSIDAYRHGRSGWWVYLVTSPVPVVNIALAAAWLLRWRQAPKRVLGLQL